MKVTWCHQIGDYKIAQINRSGNYIVVLPNDVVYPERFKTKDDASDAALDFVKIGELSD